MSETGWCGKCKHHKPECYGKPYGEWYCDNEMSENYGCETEYTDRCEDYEEREK